MKRLRIATRSSRLALIQTQIAIRHIKQLFPDLHCEIVTFSTMGDKTHKDLPDIGGKGVFTQELEKALLEGEVDIAVHSLKDLPTETHEALIIGAILPRDNPLDAFISRNNTSLDSLPEGATIGTSSPRRMMQLKLLRPDLVFKPIRGNVETRLKKLMDNTQGYDATILAVAGLNRLGLDNVITEVLPPDVMLPAPGQGAIAIQCRKRDIHIRNLLSRLNDKMTFWAVTAERSFLKTLGGGCTISAGALAIIKGNDISLKGIFFSSDGHFARGEQTGPLYKAEEIGKSLGEKLLKSLS